MSEIESLRDALACTEYGGKDLSSEKTAHIALSGTKIISMREVEGLSFRAEEIPDGINAQVTVSEGVAVENPVHLCFGVLGSHGTQRINMRVRLMRDSSAWFIAHCVFPRAEKVLHAMDARVELDEGAEMRYTEAHYHGPMGGVTVEARASIKVGKGGRYFTDFSLLKGRVGRLSLDYSVEAGESSVAEMTARVFGHGEDEITISEKAVLEGRGARSLIKARVALEDDARAEVTGITEGRAAGTRGHVDCVEIVKDRAVARAVPVVNVSDPGAKVTHEAAIGSVDRRQMETLMARGLTPEEAVDIIVKGVLK
jgi:Fe-S cluster assembly scaffold protein SufB